VEVVVGNKQIAMKRVVSVKVDYFGVLAATVRQHLVVVLALMYIKPNLAQVYYNYHTIPYHTIPYHNIPYHTIPYKNVKHNYTNNNSYGSFVPYSIF
jgi:hypothetical protein